MALEKLFADGDGLESHEPVTRLVLGDRVDQNRWIAIRDSPEKRWKIESQGPAPPRLLGRWGRWRRRLRRTRRIHGGDDLGGQVHAGVGPDEAALSGIEHEVHLLLARDLVDDRIQLAAEVLFDLLRQRLHVLLRILGEALEIALLTIDLDLQLAPCRI